jgi:cytidylate kinase
MPVIIFASDLYQESREISKKTAESLGYKYVDRKILTSAAAKHDVPEAKLIKALDETPSFMGMSSKAWKLYLAYIQEAVLGELLDDKAVCHGLAAHLYVLGVSHVLKVGIIMDLDERAKYVAEQEKVPFEKAKKIVQRRGKYRKRWSLSAFNRDETDPSRYDMVINISQITSEEAVGMITTATVRSALMRNFPDVRVQARDGTVVVEIKALKREKQKKAKAIKEIAGKISGVHYVEVHVFNDIIGQAAESGR